jgi:Tfp pilus assembly protein PilX
MKKKSLLRNQSGAALVVALLMIIILTLIGLASTITSTFEIRLSGAKRGTTDAFYAADSGVQVVLADITNFNLPGQYVNNQYKPLADPKKTLPNPTHADVTVHYDPTQIGSPRGLGMSAINFEFTHYTIASTAGDQKDAGTNPATCTVEEKVVRLTPTLQGGY